LKIEDCGFKIEEAASSNSSTSMFDVGRSMFDVQPPSSPWLDHLDPGRPWSVPLDVLKSR
jgi:hypothetical protein